MAFDDSDEGSLRAKLNLTKSGGTFQAMEAGRGDSSGPIFSSAMMEAFVQTTRDVFVVYRLVQGVPTYAFANKEAEKVLEVRLMQLEGHETESRACRSHLISSHLISSLGYSIVVGTVPSCSLLTLSSVVMSSAKATKFC